MIKSSNEVLDQIKSDRIELLKLVRNSINTNQSPILNSIDTTLELISKDENATKELEVIIKAKEMIATLMTSAALATTDEEIIAIRKKLNYYLNKVKKEIQKRKMSEELYEKYYKSMTYLREDISECLRAIKRQVKLDRLKELIDNETLTTEELKELKVSLNNEKRFNKRILKKYGSSEGVQRKIKKSISKEEKQVQPAESFDELPEFAFLEIESSGQNNENSDEVLFDLTNFTQNDSTDNYDMIFDSWQSEIKDHYYRYNLETPHEYDKHIIKNVGTLFSNIGIYRRNRNRAKQMIYDYNFYSHSESLQRLIDYTLYSNSIRGAIGQVFRNTALGRHESIKVREHRYYMEEIYNAITSQNTNVPTLVKA